MTNVSRIDLHVHTCHSNHAGDWLLSRLNVQESYTTPQQVVDLAMRRGMDWITITDHDTIEGALTMAHLDNFFISEEISAYFPDDKTKIHIVALNIDETQHRMIQSLRMHIYDLVRYLNDEEIVHFVAHPFFRMTDRLSMTHFEKMLLLFKRFEVKNGGKQIDPDDFLETALDRLTPEIIWQLSDKYDIAPFGEKPWEKFQVAGSDDHGGIHIGTPHTQCPKAQSLPELMQYFKEGKTSACGEGGSPESVAHAIMAVTYRCLESNRESMDPLKSNVAWNILGQLFNNAHADRSLSVLSTLLFQVHQWVPASDQWPAWLPSLSVLGQAFQDVLKDDPEMLQFMKEGFDFQNNNQKLYDFNKRLIHQLIQKTMEAKNQLAFKEMVKNISIITTLLLPYVISYKTEYRDRPLMRQVKRRYGNPEELSQPKIAVFSDFDSLKTARSRSLNLYLKHEFDQNIPVHVLGVGSSSYQEAMFSNLNSLFEMTIEKKNYRIPSPMEIGEWLFKDDYDTLYLHSLGPMGILGFCLGKWMGIKVIGRFSYSEVHQLIDGAAQSTQKRILKQIVSLFFSQMDQLRVHSKEARDLAIELGIHPSKIMFVGKPMEDLFINNDILGFAPTNSDYPFYTFRETNQRIEQ